MQLNDKVIFVTGGASGIGAACAEAYVEEGARVAIMDIDNKSLSSIAKKLGGQHIAIEGDVSKAEDVQVAIEKCVAHFGRIDAIHNNAGIAHPSKPLHETSPHEWDALIAVNLQSIYHTTRAGFEALRQTRGCILNTSSMVAEIGQASHAAYAATKGAVNALTRSMALDYAKDGIRVNAVAPAGVWTPMLRKWSAEQPNAVEIEEYLDGIHALGYCPEADVVADACVFLISDKARFITGCVLPVSGGAELGYRR